MVETTQGKKDITLPRQDIFKDANELSFSRSFTSPLVELLNPVTAQNSKILSEQIATLWLETKQEIEAIGGRSRHIPEEGRTIDEDLQDAIVSVATQVWSLTTPQYPDGTRVYNMISTSVLKMYNEKIGNNTKSNPIATDQTIGKEILAKRIQYTDLPKNFDSMLWIDSRQAIVDATKTDIMTMTRNLQTEEIFDMICDRLTIRDPNYMFPDDKSVLSYLANMHTALKDIVQKHPHKTQLLRAIDKANSHLRLPNGILTLRVLDEFFMQEAVHEQKKHEQKFKSLELTKVTEYKTFIESIRDYAMRGAVSALDRVTKVRQQFSKFAATKYAAQSYSIGINLDEYDDDTCENYYQHMILWCAQMENDGDLTDEPAEPRAPQMQITQVQPHNQSRQAPKGLGKGKPPKPLAQYKVEFCEAFKRGFCKNNEWCFHKHHENDHGNEAGRKWHEEWLRSRQAKDGKAGKGGKYGKDEARESLHAAAASSHHPHQAPPHSAAPATATSNRVDPKVPICICQHVVTKWDCPCCFNFDEKDHQVCLNVLEKIQFYDAIEKLNKLGSLPVISVLSSGRAALTQRQEFSVGPKRHVKCAVDGWKLVSDDRGVGSLCSRVRSEGAAVTGPKFFPREFLTSTDCSDEVGRADTAGAAGPTGPEDFLNGNLIKQEHSKFRPKRTSKSKMKKSKVAFAKCSADEWNSIVDSGASEHNISKLKPDDEVFEAPTPTYVQTANGVVKTRKKVRRFCSALKEYITALHLPYAPDLLSVSKLVENGWSFSWDGTGAFRKKGDRIVNCDSADLPTIQLDGASFVLCKYPQGQLQRGDATCCSCHRFLVAHSDFTHLGSSKFCDTCREAKIRESPHRPVDKSEKDTRLAEIET